MGRGIGGLDLVLGAALLAGAGLFALAGSAVWHADPLSGSLLATLKPPGSLAAGRLYPLGSDQIGRDVLARMVSGTRLSLAIVLAAGAVSAVLGTALGVCAGYLGGWVDDLVMRLVDIQLAIPFILLILLVLAVVGPGLFNLVAVLGITGWAIYARTARARTLEIRELEFVEAARAVGGGTARIMARHVLPNILPSQIVLITLDLPRLVVLEASVGFLGLGVQPPTPTLGNMIGDGRSYLLVASWLVLYPGIVISVLVVGFNLVGDGLVRRMDRRTR